MAESLDMAKVAAAAADAKKAQDIVLLDLRGLTDVCDYFLICTTQNNPQMDAVVEEIKRRVLEECGTKPISTEGRGGSGWLLMDYGSLVCHVFKPETRDFYRLENLWGDAPRVPLELEQ
ncbi:MAG: ribosome silencing factor [Olsenella sp.]|jgi:ribosome-associated protein|nr:ribosome silencing factor [Olsenella sp.]MCI1289503.1 ribosome silencing factor [Olsenella sp.]